MRWQKLFGALIVGVSLLAPAAVQAQGRSPAALARLQDSVQAAGGRVIVMLKSSVQGMALQPGTPPVPVSEFNSVESRLDAQASINVTGQFQRFGALVATATASGLATLNADPNVLSIEADVFSPLMSSRSLEDAYRAPRTAQTTPYGVTNVTAPESWSMVNGGSGIKVGILDSGGDNNHEDLNYSGGYNAKTASTSTSAWADDLAECNGHGTHVAGTVAARNNSVGVVGVAPNVSLYAIKVMEVQGGVCGALTSTQMAGVNWAVANGIRVVNASLGGTSFSSSMQNVVENAAANGTVFVASSGNSSSSTVYYPAAYPSAIAVGSVDGNNVRASSSNYGSALWIVAPGVSIESTMPGGGYGTKSGTSMAAPHVAGVVALILAQNPSLTVAQVKQKLKDGALNLNDPNTAWGLARAYQSMGGGSTPPPVPLAMAVSPSSRTTTTMAGTAAASDSAAITLSGDNSSSTSWSATKKKSWTTLTTGSGTGSGTARWSRSTAGLAAGIYVDTITVSAAGAAGSPNTVIDTLIVTAVPVPLALALSPSSRITSAMAGTAAPNDSATVTLSGDNAGSTGWSATKKKSWTTLTTSSGTGSGKVRWNRSTTGLAAGTYVDTITVTVAGAAGSPTRVIDTLVVTAVPVPLVLAVGPSSRSTSAMAGTSAPNDSATITLSGDNSSSTGWSATKKKSWTTLTTSSGTGSGKVRWSRSTTGLAVGTYVDTITVNAAGAAGSPTTVIDTLVITAVPVPLALALSPSSRSTSAMAGTSAPNDSATITLSGDNSSSTGWSATKKKSWTTLTTSSGTGSGKVRWSRSTTGLAVGTYVDTITVTVAGATGSPTKVIDTLVITAVPVPLALALSPTSRSTSAMAGTLAASDSATVSLTGDNAGSTGWSASKKKSWTTLTTSSGTGSGKVRWNRTTAGLAAGTYVDTITVTVAGAIGSPTRVIDTLVVTAIPIPLVLAVSPASRNAAIVAGASAPNDSASITLTGDNAASANWTAAKKKSWTVLNTSSGTGSGKVRWSRNAAGLAVGVYVDTITVTALGANGSPNKVIDTLIVSAVPVPLALALSPGSRAASAMAGTTPPSDSANVMLSGDNASSANWSATKKKSWTTLTTSSGTGTGLVRWSRSTSGLVAGIYVDTITVTAPGANGSPTRVIDTLVVTPIPVALALAVSPGSRKATAQQGTPAPSDVASITLTGDGASAAVWSATKRKSWTELASATGSGSGQVTWTRSTQGLDVGTYVDTISVSAAGVAGARFVIDTLIVSAVPVQLAIGLSPTARSVSVQNGKSVGGDSATVDLSGDGAASAGWTASKRKSWTTLTSSSGTGNGKIRWSRNVASLPVGVYVDTITVTVTGSPTVYARVIDTVRITQKPGSIVSPGWRKNTLTQSNSIVADSANLSITGDDPTSIPWTMSNRKNWNTVNTASGVGSAKVRWTRRTNGLAPGTYVDTITVAVLDADPAFVFDTLVINTPSPTPLALHPRGKFRKMFYSPGFNGASSADVPKDSALVESNGEPELVGMMWEASVSSNRLTLFTQNGLVDTRVVWGRTSAQLSAGTYIDTLKVHLVGEAAEAYFIDTLIVAQVASPTPGLAVNQLLKGGGISLDQQLLLDQYGNKNGRYDLGDFLAWVDRGGVAVSPALMQQLMALPEEKKAGGGGER